MHDRMKKAFDGVHAEEALKENTRAYVTGRLRQRQRRSFMPRLAPVLACFVCLMFGGLYAYFTPVSVISIDVNPSVELEVNRFDRVLKVTGYNDDGKGLADSLDLRFKDYAAAVEELLEAPAVTECLDNDGLLSISVAGSNEKISETMLQNLSAVTPRQENTAYYKTTQDEVKTAHQAGMSCGKYRAYLQLQELDPAVTPQQVQEMTMRQIQDRIRELNGGVLPDTGHHGEFRPEETTLPEETIHHQPKEYKHSHGHGKHD